MSTLAIELNDAGIRSLGEADRSTGAIHSSPGYAVVDGGTVVTGIEAHRQSRLKPRWVHHRFWSRLDTEPIGRPFPRDLSSADLAFSHLSSVWEAAREGVDRVLIALPGSYSERQMGLVLGIARACEMPVEGLIDAAVAAAATVPTSGRLLHLELELHRFVVTELTSDRELARQRVQVGEQAGWVRLRDTWAKSVARSFVGRTRFDPLHLAASEQALYDRLGDLLRTVDRSPRGTLELHAGGRVWGVEIERDELVAAVAEIYDGLSDVVRRSIRLGEPTTILLSDRMAGLPGLDDRLARIDDVQVVRLAPAAPARGALEHVEPLRSPGEAVPLVTRISLSGPLAARSVDEMSPPAAGASSESVCPTHVLHDGTAYPLNETPFLLGVAIPPGGRGLTLDDAGSKWTGVGCRIYRQGDRVIVEDRGSEAIRVNGRRVEGQMPVERGDRLRVGDADLELQFISVTDDHAPPRD